jgi:hypothetical protein
MIFGFNLRRIKPTNSIRDGAVLSSEKTPLKLQSLVVLEAIMLLRLPPELVERVVKLLQPPDICSLLLASSGFYSLLSQPKYWTQVKIRFVMRAAHS